MDSSVKIDLTALGLNLVKGRTYRVEFDEGVVYETASPILLPNPANNRVFRWTATGMTSDNLTFSFGAGGNIIVTFDEPFTVAEGDYFVDDYITRGYASDDLGTITLYGEDSTLAGSWTFPTDDNLGIGSDFILLEGATLVDGQYYWITIPEDVVEDPFDLGNEAITNVDFEVTVLPALQGEATLASTATVSCQAYKNVDYNNSKTFLETTADNTNFGRSITMNEQAISTTYDLNDNTEYVFLANYKTNDEQTLTNYSNNARVQLSDNYLLTGNTLNVPPITTYFDVFQTNSAGQYMNDVTIDTTVATEFSREMNATASDSDKFYMNKNGYFVFRKDDGADSILIGTITGHDNPSVSISQIDQPSGQTDENFASVVTVSEDYIIVAGGGSSSPVNSTINVYDIDTHSLLYSFSTGVYNPTTLACAGDSIWLGSLTDNEIWSVSGTELGSNVVGGIRKVAASPLWFIVRGLAEDVKIYRETTRTLVHTVGGTWTDVAILDNSYAVADETFSDGDYTNRGKVVVYY